MNKYFDPDHPIVLGLCGKAGSGKTSVAETIVPPHTQFLDTTNDLIWNHFWFAMPLYQMASIKRKTLGEQRLDRVKYQIHDVMLELFSHSPLYGAPSYQDLFELVTEVATAPITMEEDEKPRDFLQKTGTLCRSYKDTCFADWVKNRIYTYHSSLAKEGEPTPAFIVSDIRYPNEAEMISSLPNGVVVMFEASDEVRRQRLIKRDGFDIPTEQASHASEKIELIPKEFISIKLNTDALTLEEQADITKRIFLESFGLIHA